MASLTTSSTGIRRIVFTNARKERKTLYLGTMAKRSAEVLKLHVDNLLDAEIAGSSLRPETSAWIGTLDDTTLEKLAGVELVTMLPRTSLKPFLDHYIAERDAVAKPNTLRNWRAAADAMVEFLGADKQLRAITLADADSLRVAWQKRGWKDNTIRRRMGLARQFLAAAAKAHFIPADANPFRDQKCEVKPDESKYFFVTAAMANKILEACPNVQWKVIFALCRWGGLRCPSEIQALQWSDINFAEQKITVRSPKTEHHTGKEVRTIPLFPELEPILTQAMSETPEGETRVVWMYKAENANLRTTMEKIIWRAGYQPWKKLFNNLRSTRETELANQYPVHVACKWLGNSKLVAAKHYLQVTEQHFADAVKPRQTHAEVAPSPAQDSGGQSDSAPTTRASGKTTRKATRAFHAPRCTAEPQRPGGASNAGLCSLVHNHAQESNARDRSGTRTTRKGENG